MVRSALRWFRRQARDLPWRRTRDPYAIWVSEVMLQQTQVRTVIPYWDRWMRTLPSIAALARARPDAVLKLWEGLGYYRRARNLHTAARLLARDHGGRFPTTFDEVLSLPGIGRYTAGAICSIAYNHPTPVLDGNVARVLSRLFGRPGDSKTRRTAPELWSLADRLVRTAALLPSSGSRNCSDLNQALMELGAVTCTPRNPDCLRCPLRRHCALFVRSASASGVSSVKGPSEAPPRARRPRSAALHAVAFVVEHRGRYLVRRRPASGVNGRLWEFPNAVTGFGRAARGRVVRELFGWEGAPMQKLLRLKHSITRYRITLDVFRLVAGDRAERSALAGGRWCSLTQLGRLPFASAHRRIVTCLEAAKPA